MAEYRRAVVRLPVSSPDYLPSEGDQEMHRRISVLAAVVALIAVTGGTAVAAGELITRSDQIAPGVINGGHIESQSIARSDQQHATLDLRVTASGELFGDRSDGTVTRIGFGQYVLRFNRSAITDVVTKNEKNWLQDDCAVVATPRVGGVGDGAGQDVTLNTMRTSTPGMVLVVAAKPNYELRRSELVDAPFDVAVTC